MMKTILNLKIIKIKQTFWFTMQKEDVWKKMLKNENMALSKTFGYAFQKR